MNNLILINIFVIVLIIICIVLTDIYIINEVKDDYNLEGFTTSSQLKKFYEDSLVKCDGNCEIKFRNNNTPLKDIDPNIKQDSFVYESVLPDVPNYDSNTYTTFLQQASAQ